MFLSSLGGSCMSETIRRILRKIGTNKLWSSYNLKGRINEKFGKSQDLWDHKILKGEKKEEF